MMLKGVDDRPLTVSQPEFGRRLRRSRLERGLSQRQLAGREMTASYISLLESGRRVPSLNVAVTLARALGAPLDELLGDAAIAMATGGETRLSALVPHLRAKDAADAGDFDSAAAILTDAVRAAQLAGDHERVLSLGLELADLRKASGSGSSLPLIDELLAVYGLDGSPVVRLSLIIRRAAALRDAGELAEARKAALQALALLDRIGQQADIERIRVLGVLISVLSELNQTADIPALVSELLDLAERSGQAAITGRAHWVASTAFLALGQEDLAEAHLRQAISELPSDQMSLGDWLRFSRTVVSTLLDLGRDLDLADDWLRSAEDAVRRLRGGEQHEPHLRALRARYLLRSGEPARALELYRAIELRTPPFTTMAVARIHMELAEALERTGRLAEAGDALRRTADLCELQGAYQLAAQVWRQVDKLARGQAAAGRLAGE